MKRRLLELLCCPDCNGELQLKDEVFQNAEIKEGVLECRCGRQFKIIDFIPRFVEVDSYTKSFSFEWKLHKKTQLDSYNGGLFSENQLRNRLDFDLKDLNGKLVLDAGCGTGRFAEVVAKYGGEVVCADLSFSVDTAYENIGRLQNVHIIQADIFNLPLKRGIFDLVYSFGVLHHTPDAKGAFISIAKFVKKGGLVSIFVYSSYNKAIVYSSEFWRFFTSRMPKRLLYYLCFVSIPLYYIYKIPIIGHIGKMLFVISMLPNWRWRVLDTFDWYAPKYQSKHTHHEVFNWFRDAGLSNIVVYEGEVSMSGVRI